MPKRKAEDQIHNEIKKLKSTGSRSLTVKNIGDLDEEIILSKTIKQITIRSSIMRFPNYLNNSILTKIVLFETDIEEINQNFSGSLRSLQLVNNLKLKSIKSEENQIGYLVINNCPVEDLTFFNLKWIIDLYCNNTNISSNSSMTFSYLTGIIKIVNNKNPINLNNISFEMKPIRNISIWCDNVVKQHTIFKNVNIGFLMIELDPCYIYFEKNAKLKNILRYNNFNLYNFTLLPDNFWGYLIDSQKIIKYKKIKSLQDLCANTLINMNPDQINDKDENGDLIIPFEVYEMYKNKLIITCQMIGCNNKVSITTHNYIKIYQLTNLVPGLKIKFFKFLCDHC